MEKKSGDPSLNQSMACMMAIKSTQYLRSTIESNNQSSKHVRKAHFPPSLLRARGTLRGTQSVSSRSMLVLNIRRGHGTLIMLAHAGVPQQWRRHCRGVVPIRETPRSRVLACWRGHALRMQSPQIERRQWQLGYCWLARSPTLQTSRHSEGKSVGSLLHGRVIDGRLHGWSRRSVVVSVGILVGVLGLVVVWHCVLRIV